MYMELKYSRKQEGNRHCGKQEGGNKMNLGVSTAGGRDQSPVGSSAVGPVKTLPQSNK